MADEKLALEDVSAELAATVEDAANFMTGEFSAMWETSELYFAGGSDLPSEQNRSSVVKTDVMDTIRSLMPSIMRVIMQSKSPVEYIPSSMYNAAYTEQQGMWVMQLFRQNDGYRQLYNAVMESLRFGGGPIKVYWEENAKPEFFKITGVPMSEVLSYIDEDDVKVTEIEEVTDKSRMIGSLPVYDIEFVRYYANGKIVMEAVPIYEFFVERNATNLKNFTHGHRREVTVSAAKQLGIDFDDWESLDTEDVEVANAAGASKIRRGYAKDGGPATSVDLANRRILLTEAHCQYDLDNDGVAEDYVFYLGGTQNTYLAHYRVGAGEFEIACHDPMPHTVVGRTVLQILKKSADTSTSLLRALVDNAHIANNPRAAADPKKVDFNDLMNNSIGAPIKTRGDSNIQLFDVPFTAGNLLPVIQWFETETQNKIGVTKAATGLDPDALQSTDKNAVMNTIQLSQGQVELMVRNIVEGCLVGVFSKMLRLAGQHMDRKQLLRYKGVVIPVDISNYDANLVAVPNVGLGTASPQLKMQGLQFIYQEQQKYMAQFGLDNPFVSLSKLYNTIEDMAELSGISNVSRYFGYVDKEIERVIAEQMAKQAEASAKAAAENAPLDPSKVLLEIETAKRVQEHRQSVVDMNKNKADLTFKAVAKDDDSELKRAEINLKRFTALLQSNQQGAATALRKETKETSNVAELTADATGGGEGTPPAPQAE